MKKILILLACCLVFGACTTLTPEQKRELFEQKVPQPVFECGDIGKEPTINEIFVSESEVATYDYEDCNLYTAGMRPIQQINSREFLAFLCGRGPIGCSASNIFHVKFPYAIGQLGVNTYYEFPKDICRSSTATPPYSYTTQSGLKNTVYSVNLIKIKLASKAKRQKWLNKLKAERLEIAQRAWQERYLEQQACLGVSSQILSIWENSDSIRNYCEKIAELRKCSRFYGEDRNCWSGRGLIPSDKNSFEVYYQEHCGN